MKSKPAAEKKTQLKALPSIDDLLRSGTGQMLMTEAGHQRAARLSRQVVAELRDELNAQTRKDGLTKADVLIEAERRLEDGWLRSVAHGMQRIINATGVVIHTNLGRAPLSGNARRALAEVSGYTNIEYDIPTGGRGSRGERVESMLCELTGAENALVVNNCAAAAFFVLTVFAAGREVVISRGELVEIGGDFRVPDVLARSGAVLKEVGTTNRSKLADYEKAIGPNTAMVLKVHPSNYRIVGFTAAPSTGEIADLAHKNNVLFYEDAGSGAVTDLSSLGLGDEPVIREVVEAGADIVTFSGDKLLGGPQAGIIVGRRDLVQRLRRDPLYRSLRVDKLIYAALEATLDAHLRGTSQSDIPVLQMLAASAYEIEQRARSLVEKLRNERIEVELIAGKSAVGGGSAPLVQPETVLVALRHHELSTAELGSKLRHNSPPVIARIIDDKVVLDLRTVSVGEEEEMLLMILSEL
jgi:L-seryl-tRNA(Ser) seleniumtransferase